MNTIVWFRRDLRLCDNPALTSAAESGNIIPVFIHAPQEEAPWQPGAASNWWLHHSLKALSEELQKIGLNLLILEGDSTAQLTALAKQCDADKVVWNRLYEPACIERDQQVKESLRASGIGAESFNAALLFEPWQIETKGGTPYKVFTPFWKQCLARIEQTPPPLRALKTAQQACSNEVGTSIDALNLLPQKSWDKAFYRHWKVGEAAALEALREFKRADMDDYKEQRDIPALDASSRLSPHLHFGEISPRQILHSVMASAPRPTENATISNQTFLSQLGWREFAHHLLFHFPETTDRPMNKKFSGFPWWHSESKRNPQLPYQEQAASNLKRWQQGKTGISLVDAGMKQLWQTGWMHNRVRMVAGSLLTKNLGIHWHEGAAWFWDTLVDANLANNTLGWQWIAGCGADAAPYFRVFNPDTQAERFDRDGIYRSLYLSKGWQDKRSHIDLAKTRLAALEAYEMVRRRSNDA